jgi:hypothetical protein
MLPYGLLRCVSLRFDKNKINENNWRFPVFFVPGVVHSLKATHSVWFGVFFSCLHTRAIYLYYYYYKSIIITSIYSYSSYYEYCYLYYYYLYYYYYHKSYFCRSTETGQLRPVNWDRSAETGQLETGQLETGQLETGQLETGQLRPVNWDGLRSICRLQVFLSLPVNWNPSNETSPMRPVKWDRSTEISQLRPVN